MSNVSPCATCPRNNTGFCGAILGSEETAGSNKSSDWQYHSVIPASKPVLASHEVSPDVHVLCHGWAFRFLQLPDGRRQILHFLLPGDLFSTSSIFQDRAHVSVKALTTIQVSAMNRVEVQARIMANFSKAAPAIARLCSSQIEASDKMIAALGLCSGEERIAYLFLHLMRRITGQTVIREERYPLPLRQQHVAEAVGLTPVHVSRILGSFRERGIVDLSNGILEVLDMRALRRLCPLH